MDVNRNDNFISKLEARRLYNRYQGTSSVTYGPSRWARYRSEGRYGIPEVLLYDADTGQESSGELLFSIDSEGYTPESAIWTWKEDICSSDSVHNIVLADLQFEEDPNIDFENCDELESFLNQFVAKTEQKEV